MLLILSLGLLPLGIIAVLASIDNARESRARADVEARAMLAVHVQRLTLALAHNASTMRAARDAIIDAGNAEAVCQRALDRLARLPVSQGRYALFGTGPVPRCVTEGFAPPAPPPPAASDAGHALILPGGERMLVFLFDGAGAIEGIAEYRRDVLATAVNTPSVDGNFGLELVQGERVMPLRAKADNRPFSREVSADFPFADGEYALRIRSAVAPATLSEILVILAPVLMWLWASIVGWLLVQRLLLQPLARIQRVIAAYRPGDRGLDLPTIRSPAQEIAALGLAFDDVTRTVARHEAELEAAVERQKRLVREVHHRVKNNLQVVASLLNLHSRGSPNDEVAAAYGSIQRRVDALAVVHRNHYAELEENRGVALKPLISELAANLRGTAPASAAGMQIRLDIAPFYATQDVAVSIAFFITEVTEFGMLCGANEVSIVLEADEPGHARLSIEVDALAGEVDCDPNLAERVARIVNGLARQLRSTLEHDSKRGRYSVRIAVIEQERAQRPS